jgi:hypothetical protein
VNFPEKTKLFLSVEGEKPPGRICREQQPGVGGAGACAAINASLCIYIEGRDAALIVNNWASHARHLRGHRDQRVARF